MKLDDLHEVSDTSPDTIALLSDRIEFSRTEEQLVYRETEIDELWRLIATQKKWAGGAKAERLGRALEVVMNVHDLIGVSGASAAAAEALRTITID